jgi:hypothetical protein
LGKQRIEFKKFRMNIYWKSKGNVFAIIEVVPFFSPPCAKTELETIFANVLAAIIIAINEVPTTKSIKFDVFLDIINPYYENLNINNI